MKLRTTKFNRLLIVCLAALVVTGGLLAPTVIAQMPVAHWTFDEGINDYDLTTVTDIRNGNDAVWQIDGGAGLSYATGQIGGAAKLSGGTDQFFKIDAIPQIDDIAATPIFPDDPALGVGITMMAWINIDVDSNTGYKGVFVTRTAEDETAAGFSDADQNWGLAWEVNGSPAQSHIDSRVSGQAVDSPADSILTGQWHHVAMVWGNVDGDALFIPPAQVLYIDGQQVASNEDTTVFQMVSSGAWLIGEDSCCGGREFDGLIDDVAMFGSALTDAQVLAKYNGGLAGTDASGNNTGMLSPGDVDGGGVSITDFNIIRDNLGKDVNARNLGDLDGNRVVDLNDYQQWLDNAPAALAAQAMVPEPSSIVLVGLALLGSGLGARRVRGRKPE